jgi:hypothetical protein
MHSFVDILISLGVIIGSVVFVFVFGVIYSELHPIARGKKPQTRNNEESFYDDEKFYSKYEN